MEHANRKGGMTDSTWNAYDGRITTPLLRCAPWQRPADVMEAGPDIEPAQFRGKVVKAGADLPAVVGAGGVTQILAIGGRVLRHDQQFLHPGLDQLFRLAQHVRCRARHQVAAQFWDDAEGAGIVATF